jgi:signal transduction histidine kinase
LSLALAYQIVLAHHGTITAESTKGLGTTFTVSLPIRASQD